MRDLILMAVVIACSLVALRRPVIGLLGFVWLGFLNPHSMAWSIGRGFRSSLVVGASTIVGYVIGSEPKRIPRQRESFFLVALWTVFGLSTFFALYPERAFERLIFVSKMLLMAFLSTSLINTEERLRWLLRSIALPIGFYGLKGGIFSIASGGIYLVWGPEESFLYANNSIGLALVMNIPLLFYLMRMETQPWLRGIMKAMLFFSYPAIVCTYSRGAWLGLAAVTALLIVKSRHKLLVLATATALGLTILPSISQIVSERLVDRYRLLVNYQEDPSAESRFWNWEFCKRVGLAYPLTGGGFDLYSNELYATHYPEFIERWGPQKVWSCHSIWYTIFAEHGFPGLVLWVGLLVSYLLSVRTIRSYGRTHAESSWMIDCANMLEAALAAFLIVGTFLDVAYFDMFYYLVAVVIIIKERMELTAGEVASEPTRRQVEASVLRVEKPVMEG